MSHCFQLTRKGESEPSKLQSVDEHLCQHFNTEVHPENWFRNWYNIIGLGLAMGYTFREIKEKTTGYEDLIDFLESEYDATSFRD